MKENETTCEKMRQCFFSADAADDIVAGSRFCGRRATSNEQRATSKCVYFGTVTGTAYQIGANRYPRR